MAPFRAPVRATKTRSSSSTPPDQPYIVGSPESPATSARFDVSDEVRARKLYYTVKYWRKDGAFQGATQYGQSGYKVLEVVK